MEWISHRGESADAPENTLESFALARQRATDGSECDVHFTHDGKLVVCHDNTTERMGDRILNVELADAEAVRSVNVAGKFRGKYGTVRIPFFAEALREIGPGRKFYIELKNGTPELAEGVKAALAAGPLAPEQTVIISFSYGACVYAKKIMPQYRTLWLAGADAGTVEELIAKLKAGGLDGVDLQYRVESLTTPAAIKAIHDAGLFMSVWTVDDAEAARKLIAAGVDAITSNRAAAVRDELAK